MPPGMELDKEGRRRRRKWGGRKGREGNEENEREMKGGGGKGCPVFLETNVGSPIASSLSLFHSINVTDDVT